jgi:hypothetical protein
MKRQSRSHRAFRGGILLTMLVFAVVIATMLGGLGTLVISYYSRAKTESTYANALNMADAGVNYEFRKITQSVSTADLPGSTSPPGTTVSFGSGTFTVYCTMIDGSTAWDKASSPFYIFSTGTVGKASRTVQAKATGINSVVPNFGAFATTTLQIDSPSCKISNGDIGCNGTATINAGCQVPNGKCYVCGSSASESGFSGTCVNLGGACSYPTCSSYATTCFPNSGSTAPGGYSYLSSHNDNNTKCSPSLGSYNAQITGSCTLTGPCNICVSSVYLTGNQKITCNNNNGPCNIWIKSGSGSCHFDTNACVTCTSSAAANACTFVCANSGSWYNGTTTCDIHDNCSLQCNFYCCNGGSGDCEVYDTPTINGCTIGDTCHHHGATNTTTVASQVTPTIPYTGYGFGKVWTELNGM